MNTRKWIGLGLMVIGTILGFFSQYLPWHSYRNIYSLLGYEYKVIVYLQTSIIVIFMLPLAYLPIIGAFISLVGCLLCLYPFTLKIAKLLGKISGIIFLIGYLIFPLMYYLFGALFAMFGTLADVFIPSMIGGWFCIGAFVLTLAGSIVVPKSEIIITEEEKEGKVQKKKKKKKGKETEEGYVTCPSCGAKIKETDQFCPECGTAQF